MNVLLAAQQQQVTAWPQRLALTVVVVAVTALAVWGMWRSWHKRAAVDLPGRFVLGAAMVLGRLDILAVLVLLLPDTWRG